jgi:hypothetical protein
MGSGAEKHPLMLLVELPPGMVVDGHEGGRL